MLLWVTILSTFKALIASLSPLKVEMCRVDLPHKLIKNKFSYLIKVIP